MGPKKGTELRSPFQAGISLLSFERADINSLAIEVHYHHQPELVATYIKNHELADLVGRSEGLLQLREIFEILRLANR